MSPARKVDAFLGGQHVVTSSTAPKTRQSLTDLPAAVPPSQRPKPPKPVRFTLDLDAARHRFLKGYAAEIEAKGASEVMRALLDELQADPELAARVRTRVWEQE